MYSTILLCKRITHFISAQLVDYHILGLLNEIFPLPLTHHHFPICIPILHKSEMYSNSNSVGANHDHQMTRWLQDRLFFTSSLEGMETDHIDERRISNICAFLLLLFFGRILAVAGMNLLAQLSNRIHQFTALNSVHVRKLG